jgi:type III pantothenate kinase
MLRTAFQGVVKHMLLAIDVGNTQTVLGVYDGEALLRMWRIGTSDARTSDELAVALNGLFALAGLERADVDGAVLGTVVPAQKVLWAQVCRDAFGAHLLDVGIDAVSHLLDVRASGVGADRLVNAVAAKQWYGAPVIVVDLGTATDMEVVDRTGAFVGGVIAPGVEASMKSLVQGTALLPAIELADPGTSIGDDTIRSIQIGVVAGEVDRIDGLVHRIWKQLGYETPVVATGGLSSVVGGLCETVTDIDPELTLRGLRIVYESQMR